MSQLRRTRPRLTVVLAAILALILVSATTVLAATWATKGAKVQRVKVVAADEPVDVGGPNTTWADIADMSLTMRVPRGKAIFLVTFSGDSLCRDFADGGGGTVRVLVDGQELQPGETGFCLAQADNNYSGGAHSMQFFTDPMSAGTHQFTVQGRSYTDQFVISERTLSVLRAKV